MTVKVTVISISMSEKVTVPSLMMMTLIVSEESLARDTHTHARTHARMQHARTHAHTYTQTHFHQLG